MPEPAPHAPTRAPALRAGVALLSGANDVPMLFDPERRAYTRLTPAAADAVRLFDGRRTVAEVATSLAGPSRAPAVAPRIARLVGELDRAGVLQNASTAPLKPLRGGHTLVRLPLLRRPVSGLTAPAGPLADVGAGRLAIAAAGLAVTALVTAALAFIVLGMPRTPPAWPLLLVLLVQLASHEGAHALVARTLGVSIREAGVGLLFGFLPVAYVDRTDAYQLSGRRGRVAIALAGPLNDLVWLGAVAAVALLGPSAVAQPAHVLMVLQTVFVLANLNPLLPTDGFHALEAAAGGLNVRRRAWLLLTHRVLRAPLPGTLAGMPRRTRRLYVAYAWLALTYTVAVAASMLFTLLALWSPHVG